MQAHNFWLPLQQSSLATLSLGLFKAWSEAATECLPWWAAASGLAAQAQSVLGSTASTARLGKLKERSEL